MKHAYLIMAHHRPDLLELLLEALDDPRNDVYLHIDKKNLYRMEPERFSMERGRLFLIPSMKVNWGGYSQVVCELALLEAAVKGGPYSYYHLMTGATYPLRSQDEIHEFFEAHAGTEFVGFARRASSVRVKYIQLFNESNQRPPQSVPMRLRRRFLRLQKKLGVDRFRRFGLSFAKGLAYWSVTHELASYVLEHKSLIQKMLRRSYCGDEVFMHTLVRNSSFMKRIYDPGSEIRGSLRLTTWALEDTQARPGHNFLQNDLNYIASSGELFALKFEAPEGAAMIRTLRQRFRGYEAGQDGLVSIIVPVYNGEKSLRRCMDSILSQTRQKIEVLLIDDASTDRTAEICASYAEADPRVRVFRRAENGGLSAARNTGLDQAKGAFIQFADADDEIFPEMTEQLVSLLNTIDADIAECDFEEIREEQSIADKDEGPDEDRIRIYMGKELYRWLILYGRRCVVQWNKVFRRHIFDGLRFPEGKYHEDEFVIHEELSRALRVAVTDRRLYRYYRHEGSIISNKANRAQRICDACEAITERAAFFLERELFPFAGRSYDAFLSYHKKRSESFLSLPDGAEYLPRFLEIKKKAEQMWRSKCPKAIYRAWKKKEL